MISSDEHQRDMKLWSAGIGIACLLVINSTQAGPPFVTDDPEPPPPGGWEINVPFILERTPGSTAMDAPLFDFNYGLPDIQLKLEFPIKIVHEDSGGTAAGLGDMLLGVKWRFFSNEKSQFQIGMYPQLLVPTGDESHNLGEGRVAFVLPLVAQKSWDKWTLYGNVGFWWRTAAETRNYVWRPFRRGVQHRWLMEIARSPKSALYCWTRHCRRYTRDGLHRVPDSYEVKF